MNTNTTTSAHSLSRSKPYYVFINLSNGIEVLQDMNMSLRDCRFLRIQSTACEQKRWECIINSLSPDFMLLAALGKTIQVYDFGARKETSRAIWQGLEWVKYVLSRRWLNEEYLPVGRAKTMGQYFGGCYKQLSRSTKALLDYYGRYSVGHIDITGISHATTHDGDVEFYTSILLEAPDHERTGEMMIGAGAEHSTEWRLIF